MRSLCSQQNWCKNCMVKMTLYQVLSYTLMMMKTCTQTSYKLGITIQCIVSEPMQIPKILEIPLNDQIMSGKSVEQIVENTRHIPSDLYQLKMLLQPLQCSLWKIIEHIKYSSNVSAQKQMWIDKCRCNKNFTYKDFTRHYTFFQHVSHAQNMGY